MRQKLRQHLSGDHLQGPRFAFRWNEAVIGEQAFSMVLHIQVASGMLAGQCKQLTRQMMFCGDTITNRNKIRCSPWHASTDVAQARNSARKLAGYPVEVACFGHGNPILKQARTKLKEAISDEDRE